ncbi:MAG: DUF1566 domain-containing protein [Deltaproteobacteria bacterium]|nr:DUF1566 domain-containing protein [Deltaproteobacteria bacterium]
MRKTMMAVAVAGLVLTAVSALAAAPPADKCEASKNKTAGAYYSCREKAEATAITKAATPDYSKCSTKFDSSWDKAETAGAGACPDTVLTAPVNTYIAAQAAEAASVVAGAPIPDCAGDLSACEGNLAACVASSTGGLPVTGQTTGYGTGSDGDVEAGVARSFTDNGDGTITDNVTGLMWEKKDDSDLGGAAGIHDKDNTYTWGISTSPYPMDGTIVTTFLATLNAGGGFAGHTDWRVPNQFELFSLVNLGVVAPSTYSAFNTGCAAPCTVTTCSCTQSDGYWSSSTAQGIPSSAWFVDFYRGDAVNNFKTDSMDVRAVRAGS